MPTLEDFATNEEIKAEYKKTMIPLVVGVIIAVGATTIASFLFNNFKI